MTNKDKVRHVYPKSVSERRTQNGPLAKAYWLVRAERFASMYIGSGKTEAQAWKDAAENIARACENANESSVTK